MTIIALSNRAHGYTDTERFTIVCAWCDRVQHGREWRVERGRKSGARVSHGICPDCFRQQVERLGPRK